MSVKGGLLIAEIDIVIDVRMSAFFSAIVVAIFESFKLF